MTDIVAPVYGDLVDPQWAEDVTDTVNDLVNSRLAGCIGANTAFNGTLAITGGAEAAVASVNWDSEPEYAFLNGHIYKITLSTAVEHSATGAASALRIRQGQATTSGTMLQYWEVERAMAGVGSVFTGVCYIKNTTGSDVDAFLSLTIDHIAGAAANVSIVAGSAGNRTCTMTVEDFAIVADRGDLAGLIVSVT